MQTKHIVRVREDRKKELCEPEQFKALFGPFRCKREVLTKTLLVMRLTSILLLVTCLHLSAKSRAQRITLTETRSSLKKVFKEITGQTGYLFVYRDEWLRQAQQVDITVQDASLQQVLEICFSDQPFTYVIIDKMVVLKQKPEPLSASPSTLPWEENMPPSVIDVHGRVVDEKGNPLAGATVMARGGGRDAVVMVATGRVAQDFEKAGFPSTAPVVVAQEAVPTVVQGNGTVPVAVPVQGGVVVQEAYPPSTFPAAAANAGLPSKRLGNPSMVYSVAITDVNGNFELKGVPENATIVISNVGYETQEIKLNKRKELSIRLRVKVDQLKNIEVSYSTGYQVLSKERATGSYSKPDMETFKNRTSTQDLISRLEGQIPGMTVNVGPNGQIANGNGNGKMTQSATIRGKSSLQLVTEPLYVLNGVPVTDFADINMDDVADITVLKDAAAAAIWGARATNGVIVVVTKYGKRDTRIKVNYSGYINFQGKPDFGYSHVMNSRQYIQAAKETFDPVYTPWSYLSSDYIAPHELILYNQYRGLISAAQANASLDSLAAIDNTGQIKDLFYRNPFTTNHTISMSGGGSIYSFYSALSYTDIHSGTPGEKSNAYRINFTQDFNPTRDVRISLSTNLNNTVSSNQRALRVTNQFLPYQLFKDAQGNALSMNYLTGWSDSLRQDYQDRSRVNLDYAPNNEQKYGHSHVSNLGINLTGNVNIHLWKGLSYLGTYSFAKQPGSNDQYDDHREISVRKTIVGLTVAPTTADVPVYYYPTTGGNYLHSTNDQRNWTVRNQLTYIANPREGKDDLSVQAGQEAQEQLNTRNSISLVGYDEALQSYAVLDYKMLSQGIYNTVTGYGGYYSSPFQTDEKKTRFTSYFALANYTFNHKYSLDLSWRQDHSNLFGSDKSSQNRPIWSFGGKWQIGREGWMKDVTWVNDLGLRTTYGITGNSPYVGGASSKDILGPSSSYPPGISGPGLDIYNNANRTLNWETTQTLNIGIDFALLKRRISGSIDLYHKNTEDLLGGVNLNPFTGASRGTGNLGKLMNEGIELSLHTDNLTIGGFNWSTQFVFAYNKSKLVSYSAPSPYSLNDYGKLYATYWIGYKINPVFAYKWAGLDNMGDPQVELADKTVTKTPNVVGSDDMVYKGTTVPVFNGGMTNTFRYKGLSLTLNLVYSLGNVMRRDVNDLYQQRMTASSNFASGNASVYFLDRWKKPGDEKITNIPSYVSDGYVNYSRRSTGYYTYADINVVSASYAKFRDITLSYSLPHKFVQMARMEGISLNVQATNFMIWKANKDGIDPELHSLQNGYRGMRTSKHSFSIGANVSF